MCDRCLVFCVSLWLYSPLIDTICNVIRWCRCNFWSFFCTWNISRGNYLRPNDESLSGMFFCFWHKWLYRRQALFERISHVLCICKLKKRTWSFNDCMYPLILLHCMHKIRTCVLFLEILIAQFCFMLASWNRKNIMDFLYSQTQQSPFLPRPTSIFRQRLQYAGLLKCFNLHRWFPSSFTWESRPRRTKRGIVVRPPRFHSSNETVPSAS